MSKEKQIDLSIIVTAHHEGLIAHKTMRSIENAIAPLQKKGYSFEVVIAIDSGNKATIEYFKNYNKLPIKILQNEFRDVSKSRNNAIDHASGRFTSLIDADDLMSSNWLIDSLNFLDSNTYGDFVAHSEYTVEFGAFNSIVQKYGTTTKGEDIFLSVFSGRWNSVFVAPTSLLQKNPFPLNTPGYGFEDWHVMNSLINAGVKNSLIPQTVIFVRRKEAGSLWDEHRQNNALLKAHPIYKPSKFKTIDINKINLPTTSDAKRLKKRVKEVVLKTHIPLSLFTKPLIIAKRIKHTIHNKINHTRDSSIPGWLADEWEKMHEIEKDIFPTKPPPPVYHSITPDHYKVGLAYWSICQELTSDNYDYVLFVPWLTRGGADLFAINYANTVASMGKKVLVLATNRSDDKGSTWHTRLVKGIDFVEFGYHTKDLTSGQQQRILEHLIESISPKTLHILNSEAGFDFIKLHQKYIENSKIQIIATAYSESTDDTGRIFGFSHTHVPQIYHLLDSLTTDNERLKNRWIEEYSFDENKIHVHHQPMQTEKFTKSPNKIPPGEDIRILWAARITPEKLPFFVFDIANHLPDNIHIDMYGTDSSETKASQLPKHPQVHYKGEFNGFNNLPIENYAAYLYTSLFDGMPNSPIEAALSKLPIIASDVGDLKNYIGDDGIVIEEQDPKKYADAIIEVVSQYAKYKKKAENLDNRTRVTFSKQNFEKEVARMLDLPL